MEGRMDSGIQPFTPVLIIDTYLGSETEKYPDG